MIIILILGTVVVELGCRYQWCTQIPKVTMYQFYVSYFITVMSYPFSMALTSALYAGLLGNIPQVRAVLYINLRIDNIYKYY